MESLEYGKDYVLVTQQIWKAFISWYGETTCVSRSIIVSEINQGSIFDQMYQLTNT
jgi:hypothetical protein